MFKTKIRTITTLTLLQLTIICFINDIMKIPKNSKKLILSQLTIIIFIFLLSSPLNV